MTDGELEEAQRTIERLRNLLEAKDAELCAVREEADAALQAKRELIAKVSHEIRTPLNGVLGMLALLDRGELFARERRFVEAARSSGETLHALLDDLVDFSRLEAGKMELRPRVFDLRGLVEQVTELAAAKTEAKGLEVGCLVDTNVATFARADPERLRQVLVNLLSNAVKFTQAGGVTLRVRMLQDTGSAAFMRFEVRDTGIGIEPGDRPRLFEPFERVEDNLTSGGGLGLAISREILALMQSEIAVSSKPGEGSSFSFVIRVEKHGTNTDEEADERLSGCSALVVGATELNRRLLEPTLSGWRMTTTFAETGADALAAAASGMYDVVLVDARLRDTPPSVLARAIRAERRAVTWRFVLMSSLWEVPSEEEASRSGLDACVSKPIRASALRECLCRLLQREARTSASSIVPPGAMERSADVRVLLAEDDDINQEVAIEMLRGLGCVVDVAADGAEAVEAASRVHYDVIFMDCSMPNLDGFRATAEIRRRLGVGAPPIVAITALALTGDRERVLAAGMDDYIGKPMSRDALELALGRWGAARGQVAPAVARNFAAYYGRLGDDVDAIEGFAAQGSLDEMRNAAHRLRGACMVLALPKMAVLASLVEQTEGNPSSQQCLDSIAELRRELERVLGGADRT